MDPIRKIAGSTILAKIQKAATRKPKLSYLGNIWPKFSDVNINFIYLDDEESICSGLKKIGIKLHVLV